MFGRKAIPFRPIYCSSEISKNESQRPRTIEKLDLERCYWQQKVFRGSLLLNKTLMYQIPQKHLMAFTP